MDKKKKRIIVLIVLLAACGIAYIPFSIPALVKLHLRGMFPGSRVAVGKGSFKPSGEIIVEDIAIRRTGAYEITVEEIDVSLSLLSLLKARILKVVIREPIVFVTLGNQDIRSLSGQIRLGRGGFIKLEHIELFRAHVNISSKNFITESYLSAQIFPLRQLIEKVEVSIDHMRCPGVLIKGLSFYANQGQADGRLYVSKAFYNRIAAAEVEGYAALNKQLLRITDLKGKLFGGEFKGSIEFNLGHPFKYQGGISLEAIDFVRLAEELGFQKKISVSGTMNGSLQLEGTAAGPDIFKGFLTARAPGGSFIIRDQEFLKRIAQTRKEDFQTVMEAFKDYAYTRGRVNLSAEDGVLKLAIYLDGKQGKRDLTVSYHDFFR